MPRNILESRPITNKEALDILLEKIKGREEHRIIARTIEYLSKTLKCDVENTEELVEELVKLGLSREGAIVLVNNMPEKPDEALAILPSKDSRVSIDTVKKALELIVKYCGKPE